MVVELAKALRGSEDGEKVLKVWRGLRAAAAGDDGVVCRATVWKLRAAGADRALVRACESRCDDTLGY